MKFYAGIGSRETPHKATSLMARMAIWMADKGYCLRSGGAFGADSAFEMGCDFGHGQKQIFIAEDSTLEAEALASRFHPAWDRCSEYARKLHGRNMMIVSGKNLLEPVQMVICWTKDGKASGGTGQALRYSESLGIPIFNLFFEEVREALLSQI